MNQKSVWHVTLVLKNRQASRCCVSRDRTEQEAQGTGDASSNLQECQFLSIAARQFARRQALWSWEEVCLRQFDNCL